MPEPQLPTGISALVPAAVVLAGQAALTYAFQIIDGYAIRVPAQARTGISGLVMLTIVGVYAFVTRKSKRA